MLSVHRSARFLKSIVLASCAASLAGSVAAQIPVPPGVQTPTVNLLTTPSFTATGLPALGATDVAVADFDNDGVNDFVTANSSHGSLSFVQGTGGGAFAAAVVVPIAGAFTATGPLGLAVGDLNGDTLQDVVVAYPGSSSGVVGAGVFVHLNQGGFVFLNTGLVATGAPINFGPTLIGLGDFDLDLDLDVALSSVAGIQIHVNNAGAIAAAAAFTLAPPAGFATVALAVTDINGDGRADFWAAANDAANNVSQVVAALNTTLAAIPTPAPVFLAAVGNTFVSTVPQILTMAAGDIDGDGLGDAVVAGQNAAEQFLTAAVPGVITPAAMPAIAAIGSAVGPRSLRLAPEDGHLGADFVLGDDAGNFTFLRSVGPSLALVDGPYNAGTATGSTSLGVGDMDGDGTSDVVVADFTVDSAAVFSNLTPLLAWSQTFPNVCAGSGSLTSTPLSFGASFNVTFAGGIPSNYAVLFAQFGSFPVAFPDPVSGCDLWIVPVLGNVVTVQVINGAGGYVFALGTVPTTPSLIGAQMALQVLETDPSYNPVAFSAGVVTAFGL